MHDGTMYLAISGWIPERLDVKDCTDAEWTRIGRGLATGDVLLTISTADMTEAEEDRTGLVPGKCTCAPVQLSEFSGMKNGYQPALC